MHRKSRIANTAFIFTGVFCSLVLFFACPASLSSDKQTCYYVLCGNLLVLTVLIGFVISQKRMDILEPFPFVTAVYILMYYITPIICLLTGDIEWFGLDLWGGCIKGTLLASIGYFCFLIGYFTNGRYLCFSSNNDYDISAEEIVVSETEKTRKNYVMLNMLFWMIGFLGSVILIRSTGRSLMYILTLSDNSSTEITSSSSLLFLGVVAHLMLPSYLYIFTYSRSKLLKIVTFYLMAMTYLIRGFRFILVAIIMAPIVLHYLRKGKRPKIYHIAFIVIMLFVMIGIVGLARTDIRKGVGINEAVLSELSTDSIKDIIINYFSIFKNYYGIVDCFPDRMDYTYGQQIFLYTLIMFVPRAIWPGKPEPINYNVVATAISDYARKAGSAPPNLAEFYHEFGTIGIVVFMFIFGKLCHSLYNRMKRSDIHSSIAYASIYPLLLQIIIRGYTPSNFYLIVVVLVPIFATRWLIDRPG